MAMWGWACGIQGGLKYVFLNLMQGGADCENM